MDRKEKLLQAAAVLASDLSLAVVLQRIVDLAVDLTEARYGALGVVGEDGRITEFITHGVSDEQRDAIGDLPHGRGILGVLIADARPLRIRDISRDPRSVGFPPNHPPMRSFLGAPVMAHGTVFGNIYLAEKRGAAEFSGEDERDLVVLATQAGMAVANARLFEETRFRERWLEAVRDITTATLAGSPMPEIIQRIATAARDLVHADVATIATPGVRDPHLVIRAAEGAGAEHLRGEFIPLEGTLSGEVIRSGETMLIDDLSRDPRTLQPIVKLGTMGPALVVPLSRGERAFGTLTVARIRDRARFVDGDLVLLRAFADQAALALEYARAQRELQRLAVMDDRERIAKELHDGAIQSLFAVGMGLQATANLVGEERLVARIERAVEEIDRVIADLRSYIFGLRPQLISERQLDEALQELVRDFEERTGITAVLDVDPRVASRLGAQAGDVVQVAREALSNVSRHAKASTCRVSLHSLDSAAVLEVDDDGKGFDPTAPSSSGQGLRNIQERAQSLGGTLEIESSPGRGTSVRVAIPDARA